MTQVTTVEHHGADERDILGFWIYILTDCILFSCLFATYAVLYKSLYDGVPIDTLISLPYTLGETLVLLFSSFTFGMSVIAFNKNNKLDTILWLLATITLGYIFMSLEVKEFIQLVNDGYSWQRSAAMTAFFSLVGTHGLHVTIGLLCMMVVVIQLLFYGITPTMKRRLTYIGMFWAFLDIIWIFVFTIVYLMGAV